MYFQRIESICHYSIFRRISLKYGVAAGEGKRITHGRHFIIKAFKGHVNDGMLRKSLKI